MHLLRYLNSKSSFHEFTYEFKFTQSFHEFKHKFKFTQKFPWINIDIKIYTELSINIHRYLKLQYQEVSMNILRNWTAYRIVTECTYIFLCRLKISWLNTENKIYTAVSMNSHIFDRIFHEYSHKSKFLWIFRESWQDLRNCVMHGGKKHKRACNWQVNPL